MPDFTWERPPVVRPYIRIGSLSFHRIYDGSVIVQLGAEYSTRLTPTEWGQVVDVLNAHNVMGRR